jgi:serine/threonine protein kinase
MTTQVIERGQLGALTKVGQGGQGVVYRAPNVKTNFAPSMVYKEYKDHTRAGIDFTTLAAMPALVEESLTYAQAEHLVSIAAWPCRIVETGRTPSGFVMPAIPEAFFIPLTTSKGVTTTTAEFQHLLNHPTMLAARGITLDDVQRYTLLREVASGLAFLHKHGVCVGDISPKNLLFSLTPREAVYFIDCDAMRINGVSALPQVETPGWSVPAGEELATVYSDTYKLGLLAVRLLAGDQDTTSPQHLPASTPDLVRQVITDTLGNPPGQRPLPEAWKYVLGHAIEYAQHQKLSTPAQSAPPVAPLPDPAIPVVRSRPPVGASRPPAPSVYRAPAPPPSRPPANTGRYSQPPATFPPPPLAAPPASVSRNRTAGIAIAVGVVVLAVLIVPLAVYAVRHRAAPAPEASSKTSSAYTPAPGYTPSPVYTPSPRPVYTPPPAAAPAPTAAANLAGLAPFVGEWDGMRERVTIDASGQAHFHYMDSSSCQSCAMANMPYAMLDFVLTSAANGVATGSVTASTGTRSSEVGESVTVTLKSESFGQTIQWAIGGKDEGLCCAAAVARQCGG